MEGKGKEQIWINEITSCANMLGIGNIIEENLYFSLLLSCRLFQCVHQHYLPLLIRICYYFMMFEYIKINCQLFSIDWINYSRLHSMIILYSSDWMNVLNGSWDKIIIIVVCIDILICWCIGAAADDRCGNGQKNTIHSFLSILSEANRKHNRCKVRAEFMLLKALSYDYLII